MAKKKHSGKKNAAKPAGTARRKRGFDLTLLGVWVLLLVPPLVFLPGLTDNFRPPKLFATELIGLFSLALLAFRLWKAPVEPRQALRHPALWIAALVAVASAASALASDHQAHVWRSLPSLWIGLACWTGWSLALRATERRTLLRALVWPASLLAILGILQFHGIFDPFIFERRLTQRLTLTSLAGGAFDLAGYLFLPLLILQSWLRSAEGRARLLPAVLGAICLYALLLTQTLTVVIAFGVATVVFWWTAISARRRLATGLAAAAVGLLLVALSPLGARVSSKLENLRQGDFNRVLTGRLDGWRAAVHMTSTHPLAGVGPGAFRAEFGEARLALTEAGVSFFRGQHQVFFVNAHNDFLEAAAEWGGLGVLALGASGVILFRARRRRRPGEGHTDEVRRLEPAVLAGMGALAATNFPFHVGLIAYPWLLFLSGMPGSSWDETAGERADEAKPRRRLGPPLALVLAGLCLVATGIRFSAAKDLLGADRLVAIAEGRTRAVLAAGRSSVPGQVMQQNIALLKRARELDPASVSAPLALAGQYMIMKRYAAAIRSLEEAAELEPRAEAYANLGRCYLAVGESEKALEAIDTAIKLDHNQRRIFRSTVERERRRQKRLED